MASKGKGIAIDGYGSSGKRKRDDNDKDGRSRKNPGVLQFFEHAADVDDVDDVSESSEEDIYYDEEFWEEEFGPDINTNNAGKGAQLPVFPKEEQLSEDELDKMMEERYKPGAGFVTFAEDRCNKGTMERNTIVPSAEDPTVWKVKCVVGRERISSFCLMQKYIDLRLMGTSKLHIISAFALDHVKGFIFIEAEKQCDIYEACQGLCNIYAGRSAPIPKNDVSHLLCVRTKSSEISVGTWARVKSGRYKGDLAQIFAVNDGRKKATVKLIPRIDLQALAQKFGGGARVKNSAIPPPKLLSSSELEEFKPLIQIRKDRDTGKEFEVLDGMLLKDGYLYKKVPIDSLSLWGVLPTEEELLKFETPARNDELKDLEWLSKLYGDEKKPRRNPVINDKGGGKGEGSSSSMENSIEVHDLVIHGRKGFGVIIGMEKDETYRVLKEGTKGSMVVTAKQRELKKASLDKKFNAFDHNKKTISLNDTVRILEGPSENKIGIVKQIYRGTIFVHDENETQDGGYFCSKAEMCEKVKPSTGSSFEKGGGSGFADFEQDPVSSPKALAMDNNRSFSRDDNNSDDMFSIGQSLRIKVGPLKGYLCKVLAVRRSDVTVKLDSQHKILTVKSDLLSEVREKTAAVSTSDDPNSDKSFGLLGTGDGPGGWLDGAGTSADAGGWNTGGASGWGSANPSNAGDNDADKDAGGWGKKVEAPSDDSSWGKKAPEADSEQVGGWGQSSNDAAAAPTNDGWGSGAAKTTNDDTWGNKGKSVVESSTSSGWGNAAAAAKETTEPAWGKPADVATDTGGWGSNPKKDDSAVDTGGWGNPKKDDSAADTGGWGNTKKDDSAANTGGWGNPKKDDSAADTGGWGNASDKGKEAESTWGKAAGGTESKNEGWGNSKKVVEDSVGGGGWGQASGGDAAGSGGSAWGKKDDGGGSAWGKKDDGGGSSWGNSGGGSSWGKPSGGGSTWGADDADQSSGGRGRGRGGGGGRGSGCFKCGEEGHMSRECPSGGRGGGRGGGGGSCFKCGEEGHFSRECPNGGGGGGGRGGGGNCYKCGEEGHISRECPSGGGGGRGGGRGRGCFKCGEEGHISRECPNGGGGGGGSWNSSSQEGRGGWSSGGGGGGWGSKPEASSDSGAGGGGAGGWGSKPEAASDGGAGGGGWSGGGGGGGGWGSKSVAASDGAAANEAGGGWGSKAKASDDVMKLSDGAEGSVLGKPPSDAGGSSWGKPPPATGGGGSSWGKPEADSTGGSSWGPANATVEGSSWGKPASDAGGGSSWGKPQSDGGGSSWGKPQSDGGGSSWGGGGGGGSSWGGGGGGGGRGRGCFKCGEEGHMSRECPSGGGGGGGRGRGCFKCGEEGHMSRECPSGGGGGGGGRGGGGGCYKCGENGHFARECPTS